MRPDALLCSCSLSLPKFFVLHNFRKCYSALLLLVLAFILPLQSFAAMTSTNFQIQWDSVASGGNDTSTSTSYKLRDTIGVTAASNGSSTTYSLRSGYGSGVYDPTASFEVHTQDTSTQVAATVLSGTTVTVTTVAGFSVGDWIAVIQDEGQNQVSQVAKIASISSPTITVDFWTTSGSTPVIDGSNDYAYRLSATTVSFGTLSSSIVDTAIVAWEATADVAQGYSTFVFEDHDFNDGGANTVDDVLDGAVTAGAEEYGARSSDTTLANSTFDTADTAISSTPTQVASRSDNSFKARDFITLKLAISASTPAASYSHTLSIVYVGDY